MVTVLRLLSLFRGALPAVAVGAVALTSAATAGAGYAEGVAAYGRGAYGLAAREFRAAAEGGDVESAYMLGRLYAMGDGVPQDWSAAWAWHDRAARHGHEMARESRDSLEAIMTPAQMARAETLAGVAAPQSAWAPPQGTSPQEAPPAPLPAARRQVVIIPRSPPPAPAWPPTAPPARLSAPAATYEGLARAGGSFEDEVRVLQQSLNRAGYVAGPVDGRLGPMTRDAIRAYQVDSGLPADGRMSVELFDQLIPPQQAEVR